MTLLLRGFLSLFINAIALLAVAQLFDSFHLEGFGSALLASLILAILNIFVRPILILLTLPITVVTFGLFLVVINALTLMITQALMDSSFVIDGFGMALIASIIISIITLFLNRLVVDTARHG